MKIKKKTMIIAVATILIVGISFGVIHHQKVEAERIAQEEQDAKLKEEKEALDITKKAIDEAYKTRNEKDIKTAEAAISKLNDNQKKDKVSLTDKLTELTKLLNQLNDVNKQLSKTEKSKSQADIDATQQLIDKLTDDYLKKDKDTAQKKLDEIKTQLSTEKEQAEKAKKEALVTQESNEDATQAETFQPTQPQYQEQPEPAYTLPVENGTSAPTYPPSTTDGGASNSNAVQDAVNNTPTPPSQDLDTTGTNGPNGWEIEGGW
ncbi:hypothetical protein HCA93_03245 [Listeria innocua]|uniref:hypothetical protein n=1 Tax=Listeria innocua TaxID=1642 RepID=UPI001629CB00|nr:hypothetical protein [Listeria innocua]MBC2135324.1 hypothetical protein [Listeria innocua]